MDKRIFFNSANSLTSNVVAQRIVYRYNLSAITKCITKTISVIDKSKLFRAITIIDNKLSPINYLDKCPSLLAGYQLP